MAQFKEIDDINFPFEVGALPRRDLALKFADYLHEKGIKATVKPGFGASYSIYVANEKDVSTAKLELLRFGNNPFAKAYNQASWNRGRTVKREKVMGSGGFLSFSLGTYRWTLFTAVSVIEIICLVVFLLMLLPGLDNTLLQALTWSRLEQITADFQIYRVLTPALVHFGFLHIAFNLVMFEAFARPIERHFGLGKILYLVIAIALVSNIMQFIFLHAPGMGNNTMTVFGGLSGVVYGVIGYMGILSRRSDLPSDLRLPPGLLLVSVLFILFGFFLSGIANICHLGGLLMGMALGGLDFKRPLD